MPNHVTNRIEYRGDPETIRRMLEEIKADEYGIGTLDFNKIIPMPESLNIEAGSRTDQGLKYYKGFMDVYTLAGTMVKNLLDVPVESEKTFLAMRPDIPEDEWELGKTAFQNIMKYGAPTWYEWSIQHWGTKWNAYDCVESHDYSQENMMEFKTAWAAPHVIMGALAARYPEIEFTHSWADEDIGHNCGRREYEDGFLTEEYYPAPGAEAIYFAAEVMDAEPEDWGLLLNCDGTDYIYAYDKEYEPISVLDTLAVYTDKVLEMRDVPEGTHCYYVSEKNGEFESLSTRKTPASAGTILTKEPLETDSAGMIRLGPDEQFVRPEVPCISLSQFMREDYSLDKYIEMGGQTM